MLLAGLLMGCPGRSNQTQTPPGPVEPEQTETHATPKPTPVATDEAPADDATAQTPEQPEKGEDQSGQGASSADLPGQGQPCPQGHCRKGLSCLTYYGIAGPQGPKFTSCEISCIGNRSACPEGQHCITIADGPGQVCRPR